MIYTILYKSNENITWLVITIEESENEKNDR